MLKSFATLACLLLHLISAAQTQPRVHTVDSMVIKKGLRIGSSSLHLGSTTPQTLGIQNYIYTTGGPLLLNQHHGKILLQTEIALYNSSMGVFYKYLFVGIDE